MAMALIMVIILLLLINTGSSFLHRGEDTRRIELVPCISTGVVADHTRGHRCLWCWWWYCCWGGFAPKRRAGKIHPQVVQCLMTTSRLLIHILVGEFGAVGGGSGGGGGGMKRRE